MKRDPSAQLKGKRQVVVCDFVRSGEARLEFGDAFALVTVKRLVNIFDHSARGDVIRLRGVEGVYVCGGLDDKKVLLSLGEPGAQAEG